MIKPTGPFSPTWLQNFRTSAWHANPVIFSAASTSTDCRVTKRTELRQQGGTTATLMQLLLMQRLRGGNSGNSGNGEVCAGNTRRRRRLPGSRHARNKRRNQGHARKHKQTVTHCETWLINRYNEDCAADCVPLQGFLPAALPRAGDDGGISLGENRVQEAHGDWPRGVLTAADGESRGAWLSSGLRTWHACLAMFDCLLCCRLCLRTGNRCCVAADWRGVDDEDLLQLRAREPRRRSTLRVLLPPLWPHRGSRHTGSEKQLR
jgi:hypothetical protein